MMISKMRNCLLPVCAIMAACLLPGDATEHVQCLSGGEGCEPMSIANITVPDCPAASCRGQCGSMDVVSLGHCYCNDGCMYLGDCCPDYQQVCENTSPDYTQNYWDRVRVMSTVECVHYTSESDDIMMMGTYINTVVKCHPQYSGPEEEKILCENNTYNDRTLENVVLVYNVQTSLLFKNRFCSRCNFFNDSDIQNLNPDFLCPNDEYVGALFRTVEFKQFLTYLLHNCEIEHNFQNIDMPLARLSCPWSNPQSSHPLRTKEKESLLLEICFSYSSYVLKPITSDLSQQFKNIHCALASGEQMYNVVCPDGPLKYMPLAGQDWTDIPSFTILMDFTQSTVLYNKLPACKNSQALDLTSEECVQKTCPPATINVQGTCYKFNNIRAKASNLYKTQVDVYIELAAQTNMAKTAYFIDIFNGVKNALFPDTTWSYSSSTLNCSELPQASRFCRSLVKISIGNADVGSTISLFTAAKNIKLLFQQISSFLPTITQIIYMNYNASNGLECEGSSRLVWPADTVLLADSVVEADYVQNPVQWRVNSSGDSYTASMAAVEVTWTHDYVSDLNNGVFQSQYWDKESHCGLCDSGGIHTCPKLAFTPDQYSINELSDGLTKITIEFDDIKKSLHVRDMSYIITDDDLLVICVDWFTEAEMEQTLRQVIHTWLTIIGMTLSIASLLFTLTTLLLFPELQNVPGRIVLRLSASLLVAQFLFLTHYLYVVNAVVCKLVASVEHYFWLVSFGWMNTFALNVSSSFINMYRFSSSSGTSNSRMKWYELCAWGIPLLIVGTCNAIEHLFDHAWLEYGAADSKTCWISPPRALLYVFALPLAIVMLINMVCFFVTIFIFLHFRQSIRQAVDEKMRSNNHEMAVASVKLSLVMGFTWLSGFLANIPSLSGLWYVFILLNSTQGAFLFSAFGFNSRIMLMYKRLVKTGSRFSESSSQFSSKSQRSTRASATSEETRKSQN